MEERVKVNNLTEDYIENFAFTGDERGGFWYNVRVSNEQCADVR